MTATTPDTALLHRQLEAMRPQLVRFAQLQLRNESLAEDAVQDAHDKMVQIFEEGGAPQG